MEMFDKQQPFNDAIIDGMLPDGCGLSEKYYDFGAYIDYCGLNLEEAVKNLNKQAGLE